MRTQPRNPPIYAGIPSNAPTACSVYLRLMKPYRLTNTCALQHHNGDAVVDPGAGLSFT